MLFKSNKMQNILILISIKTNLWYKKCKLRSHYTELSKTARKFLS